MVGRLTKAEQLERAILDQIERLDARINRLRAQQAALRSALIDNRVKKLNYKGSIRKNSFSRLVVSNKTIDKLKSTKGDVQVLDLYKIAISGNQDAPMPMATFRSHLHRMKKDGLIISGQSRGSYRLGPSAPKR